MVNLQETPGSTSQNESDIVFAVEEDDEVQPLVLYFRGETSLPGFQENGLEKVRLCTAHGLIYTSLLSTRLLRVRQYFHIVLLNTMRAYLLP